jgi:hypothetical protein
MSNSLLALSIGVLAASPPEGEAVPVQQPGQSTGGEEQQLQGPSDWQEEPAPGPQPAPAASPPPRQDKLPEEDPAAGLGMLVAGPLTVALGIPLSFAGNIAWRDACGPTNTDAKCAGGSTLSALSHTLAGIAFAGGSVFTGVGANKRGHYDATVHIANRDTLRDRGGFIAGGAVLLPAALIGMGMARLFFWLPTPSCTEYACVQQYQMLSTLTVGGTAILAATGAGLLMYGLGYKSEVRRYKRQLSLVPQGGRGYAGLSLSGRF